jgi:hypothetical protein
MLGASAFDEEAGIRPKAALVSNLFYTLKPPWIMGVVIWKVE